MTNEIDIAEIVTAGESRVFSLTEAKTLFPMVRHITQTAYAELEPVRKNLDGLLPTDTQLPQVEMQYETIVKRWVGKMGRLGLVVKGLWLVDFDTGDGYLCWKFPELRLAYYHCYDEGFANRRPLEQVMEEMDPDWSHA
ncbi:MAG: DUF2203 family protein [Acidiferrobacterales bacterium]